MKRYLSAVIGACLGLCAGFALCYLGLVFPHRKGKATTPAPQQMVQQEKVTITIARDGGVSLAGERLDLSQLSTQLKELGPPQPVIIRADSNTGYKRLVEVVDACKAATVSQLSVATVTAQAEVRDSDAPSLTSTEPLTNIEDRRTWIDWPVGRGF